MANTTTGFANNYSSICCSVILLLFIKFTFSLISEETIPLNKNDNDHRMLTSEVTKTSQNFGQGWQTFRTQLNKDNLNLACTFSGYPICCDAVNELVPNVSSAMSRRQRPKKRGIGNDYEATPEDLKFMKAMTYNLKSSSCVVYKEYHSSPYERMQFAQAKVLHAIDDINTRKAEFIKFITSPEEITRSRRWLQRIKIHMRSEVVPENNADDEELLSRFVMTRSCHIHHALSPQQQTLVKNVTWIEWIEPLTVHARHPFSYTSDETKIVFPGLRNDEKVGLINADYVLLQSGAALFNHSHVKQLSSSENNNRPKHFLFDAGTSSFDSSLYWFTCGYSQRKVAFDRVYGWEMSKLNPTEFWAKVPPLWKPYYQFLNVPIHSDTQHPDSPLRFIKDLATKQDFVVFKLDVDHAPTEVPIAQSILADKTLVSLIDEFFFELHFDCEVLSGVDGWLWGILGQKEFGNLKLNRYNVMQFFYDMRKEGIRAHFWP